MSWNILPKNVLQYFLTKLKAIFDTKVNKSGDTVNGCLIVQNTGSNFDEGVRINKNSNDLSGYVSFVLGSAKDSAAGIQDGAWWIGLPPIANGRKLYITHNGSTQGETYFEADSANRKSPALRLGWSGNVADGNAYAVTGDVVYDYITSHMLNARPDASGNMNDAAGFGNSMGMIRLSGTDETVNPNGHTGWHHFINMSYRETSGSNMWQTQLACQAGSSDIFIRSRSGGSVTAGTAWAAPWVRLVKGILRVAKSCNWMPGKNGVYFEEYTAGANYNLPSNAWYHIISMQGPDTNYGTQLALGMTTEGAYYRCYNNQSWGAWKSLINTNTNDAVTQTQTLAITSENKWYRLLYSGTADDTTRTEGARKGGIQFNPMRKAIALTNTNSFLISGQTNKSLITMVDGDYDHGLCHRAVNGADDKWGLMPYKDGWLSLGHGSYRWGQIYSTNSSISTSDRNEKKDISPLDEKAKDFIMALNPVSYKFIEGKTGRTHYGMIAQDVEEEMSSLGMTDMDFAGFCKDQKVEENYIENEDGTKTPDFKFIDDYRYGLRYEEFIAPMIKTIQLQQKEIEELKHRIDILEGK